MAKEIWKFQLLSGGTTIDAPVEKFLTVGMQRDFPFIWAIVDPDAEPEKHRICVRGTGHAFDDTEGECIGKLMMEGGSLVFHVFESLAEE